MTLTTEEIDRHSRRAVERWKQLWIDNCKKNDPLIATSQKEIQGVYRGKPAFLFAYGPSFKKNVEQFKRLNLKSPVIGCVDKAFKALVEYGIQPTYTIVADGSVETKKWLKGVPDEAIRASFLISNVYGAPDWARHWAEIAGKKSIYWYLNKDDMKTQDFFSKFTKCIDVTPAASNVGNALVVLTSMLLECNPLYLLAFDYCWDNGLYYGTVDNDKKIFCDQVRTINKNNRIVHSSINMDFSSKWLDQWILYDGQRWGTKFYDLTGNGILKNAIPGHFSEITA